MTRDVRRISRRASWLLRHGARESGLAMDAAGWASINDVLAALGIDRASLDDVVTHNDKSRLVVDGDRIRASQGHSLAGTPVTREALEASWRRIEPARLFHATFVEAIEGIARAGLLPGKRTHVHLASSNDSHVGKRGAIGVMLVVDGARLKDAGVAVFESDNGVLLARAVPREAIVDLLPQTKRARTREGELRALLELA
jgi:putative RNA 2'-phosphotransferase